MKNKEFATQLEERTLNFGAMALKISSAIPYSIESKVVRSQFTRSATSVGANYHEASRSRSKAEFKSKIRICEGEAIESIYWLKLALKTQLLEKTQIVELMQEASELLAIFTSIGKKLNVKK